MKNFLYIAAVCAAFCLSCARSATTPKPAAQPSPVTQKGWESSGGGGVACFPTEAEAKLATERTEKAEDLGELKQKLTSLVTLDYWDFQATYHFNSDLEKVRAMLEQYAPIFQTRFRLVQARLTAEKTGALPLIEDRHPKRPLEKNCALVQLAVRDSRSTPGRFPEVRLEIDESLASHLDAANRALLTLHEELYLLGKETPVVHQSSDDIRALTAVLLSKELSDHLAKIGESARARVVQNLLVKYFGDYYFFFIDDPLTKPSYAPVERTPYSRFLSFGSLLKKMRELKGKCLAEKGYAKAKPDRQKDIGLQCDVQTQNSDQLMGSLTEEEAFLYVNRWVAGTAGLVSNAENSVRFDLTDPVKVDGAQLLDLKRTCFALHFYDGTLVPRPYARAHAYCESLGFAPPSLKRFHCKEGPNEVTLTRAENGTFALRITAPKVNVSQSGLYCLHADNQARAIGCENGPFAFFSLGVSQIDPDSNAAPVPILRIGWDKASGEFSDKAQCELE